MYRESLILSSPISLSSIPYLWQQSDVLIFLVNLDDYAIFSTSYLNKTEMEYLERLKTGYFKKRYIVSRTVLKHILYSIIRDRSVSEISTYKDGYGKVYIHNYTDLHVCISYTQSTVVLAISKIKIGIDIELGRTLDLKSNLKYLGSKFSLTDKSINEADLLKIWTLKEAYSKFSNQNMHFIFSNKLDLSGVSYLTYFLDNKYMLSIITYLGSYIISINHLLKIDCNWK
jgi:4'-phosphopantetheinyl transferase